MDNIQHLLNKIRSPRVQITYDLETNGATVIKEIPYILTILSDLKGDSTKNIPYHEKKFIQVNGTNFNNIMADLDVRWKSTIPLWKTTDDSLINLDLPIHCIHDFTPDHIINNLSLLKDLKNKMFSLRDLKRKISTNNCFIKSLLTEINGDQLKKALKDQKDLTDEDNSPKKKNKG